MFFNIRNPLSLRVKSKRAELYVLRKKDAFNIKRDYQNIWQRLNNKSIHNIKSLKSLTLYIINRYCEMNGIIVKGKEIVKSSFGKTLKKNNNTNKTNNISNKSNNPNNNILLKPIPENSPHSNLNSGNKKVTSLKSSSKPININVNDKNNQKEKVKSKDKDFSLKLNKVNKSNENKNSNDNFDKKEIKKERKSVSNNKKRKISKSSSSSSLSFNLNEKKIKKKIIKHSSLEQNLSIYNFKNNPFQKRKISRKSLKKYSMIKGPIFRGNLSLFANENNLQYKYRNSNKTPKISNKNNLFAAEGISYIKDFNIINSKNNLNFSLTKESTISFEISSCYKNINEVAKGQYIKNNKFQNLIQKIVKYYIKKNLKEKNSDKKNYYEYFKDKIQKEALNKKNIKQSGKNKISEKNYLTSEKNKNTISIDEKYSKSSKDKSLSLKEIKNIFIDNNQNNNRNPLPKGKYILDPGDNKSINSTNKLNSNNVNYNHKILSECNNNATNELLNKNESNYKHVQTFQEIKNEIENKQKGKKKVKQRKSVEKLYSNQIIGDKSGNSIHEVNLNYVNNFCSIY